MSSNEKENRLIKENSHIFFISNSAYLNLFKGIILVLEFGPSKTTRNLFVNSAMESSAGKFMATLFIPKSKIK